MKNIFILTLTLTLATTLSAQELLKKTLLERMVEPKVTLNSSYISKAGFESGGEVEVQKNSVSLNNGFAGISYTNWQFAWNGVEKLPFGDKVSVPIKQMHRIKANISAPYPINDKWFMLSQISVNSTYEKEMSDSYGGGIFSFFSYKMDEDHTFQFGAFANYHPIKTLALPVMSYSYRARKRDGLQVVLGFPRTYVGYHLNETTLVRFGALFSQSVIKLSSNSVIQSGGYVEAKDYMSSFGVSYEASDALRIEIDLLYSLSREFNFFDSAGNETSYHSINPSLGANMKLSYRF